MTKVVLPTFQPTTSTGFTGPGNILPISSQLPQQPQGGLPIESLLRTGAQSQQTGGLLQQTLTPAINQFGTQIGFGSGAGFVGPSFGAPVGNLIGPTLPGTAGAGANIGALGSTTTLSGALGGAGIGGLVGTVNPFARNQQNSQIGGTIGGAAGSLFGPVGTAVGSIAGSLLGGFIGGGKPHPEASFAFSVLDDNSISQPQFLAKHFNPEDANPLAQVTQNLARSLQQQNVNLQNTNFQGGITQDKAFFQISNDKTGEVQRIIFDPNNQDETRRAMTEFTADILTKSGDPRDAAELVGNISTATGQSSRGLLSTDTTRRSPAGVPLVPQGQVRNESESFSDFVARIRG